jgi:hypothetical protein
VQLRFDSSAEDYHGSGAAITDVANDRLVIPKTGIWALGALLLMNNYVGGLPNAYLFGEIRVSGGSTTRIVVPQFNIANYNWASRVLRVTAGSFITLWAATNVDGIETIPASSGPLLEATYLGPIAV